MKCDTEHNIMLLLWLPSTPIPSKNNNNSWKYFWLIDNSFGSCHVDVDFPMSTQWKKLRITWPHLKVIVKEGIIFFTHKVNIYFLLLVIVFTQNREIHVTEYKKF